MFWWGLIVGAVIGDIWRQFLFRKNLNKLEQLEYFKEKLEVAINSGKSLAEIKKDLIELDETLGRK
jgi:hypothetical protein